MGSRLQCLSELGQNLWLQGTVSTPETLHLLQSRRHPDLLGRLLTTSMTAELQNPPRRLRRLISRNFRGQHGKAFLFSTVVNIKQADAMETQHDNGRHIVRDIKCKQCDETVGWKYDKAYEAAEKYKEGKFILESELLCTVT